MEDDDPEFLRKWAFNLASQFAHILRVLFNITTFHSFRMKERMLLIRRA